MGGVAVGRNKVVTVDVGREIADDGGLPDAIDDPEPEHLGVK